MIASDQRDELGVRTFLSFQHPVDCNYYSQGCSGGFPEQVVQFAEEHGILVRDDYPYLFSDTGFNGQENECQTPGHREGRRYFFTAGQVVGGYYGAPFDPEEMKWELYRHGPLVVNVLVDDEGYFMNGSIYGPPGPAGQAGPGDATSTTGSQEPTDPEDQPRHYFVEEIDHSILLYGWKTLPNGTQVWLCMNSWGPDWNGDGTIQIAIGSNEYGVESQVVTFYWVGDARAEPPEGPARLSSMRALDYVALILADSLLGLVLIGVFAWSIVSLRRKPYARIEA